MKIPLEFFRTVLYFIRGARFLYLARFLFLGEKYLKPVSSDFNARVKVFPYTGDCLYKTINKHQCKKYFSVKSLSRFGNLINLFSKKFYLFPQVC